MVEGGGAEVDLVILQITCRNQTWPPRISEMTIVPLETITSNNTIGNEFGA